MTPVYEVSGSIARSGQKVLLGYFLVTTRGPVIGGMTRQVVGPAPDLRPENRPIGL